jgi:signal transduction histidine kinase
VGISPTGRVTSLNQAAGRLLGIEPTQALGLAWQEVLDPDRASAGTIADTLESGNAHRGAALMLRSRGTPVSARAEIWTSPSLEGRVTHVLLETRAEGTGASDPLRRLGEASACVAHQIKNSIHALQLMAQQLDRESGSPRVAAGARQWMSALKGLSALVEDVLAVGGARPAPKEEVTVGELVRSASALIHNGAERIRSAPDAQSLTVRGSRAQLVHAVFNLLDNACRETRPGSHVDVRARTAGGRVVVEISDRGPGLPPGFGAAHAPVESRTGSGFGLLASRRFIESAGGRLSFRNETAGGAVCVIELPGAPATGTLEEPCAS